uniref:uncharacterized protein isoform X3 n=1 Tax=Pristiophorus japonicus TaxID=55135 RepID=UPI00398F4D70
MEAASDTPAIEYTRGAVMGLVVDSLENISTDSSSEAKCPSSTGAVGYTVDAAQVEVSDITVAGSLEDCWEAQPENGQREKKLTSVFVGCGFCEELDFDVKGLMSEHASKEPDPESGHQWGKDRVHGHRSIGVLAVYYVNKPPVIQLLEACDRDIQPDLFLCLEDTTETATANNSLSGISNSMMIEKGQFDTRFDCSKDFTELQEDQELEETAGEMLDFGSDQVPLQQMVRRQRKNRRSTAPTARIVIPRLSSEEIRSNVCSSFHEILMHRLRKTDDLNLSEDAVQAVATEIEKDLFMLFYCTNSRYKNKYRSLMFNLKDPRNTHLFRQVLLGEITPQCLVLMSPTELASLELMEWREREIKHNIKLMTTESGEFERQPLIKLTHKGEVEIERDTDQNLTLEDLMDSSPKSAGNGELSEAEISRGADTTHQHRSHLLDSNCQICTAPMVPPVQSRLRRSKESWGTSLLPSWVPDISAAEITLSQSKHFSPMESRSGSPNPTNRTAASKRFLPQKCAVWKGFIQMSNMKRFLVKAYPVLGHTDHLTKVLSTTLTVGRCVLPDTIWDSVDRLLSSGTKEMCVVRFKPATSGDLWPYVMYYSYLNSRQRYGAVVLEQRSAKNMYLIPLPALQKVPSRLPPLSGPGLESSHPDLLLALAFSKKQHSAAIFRKSHECRRGPERCLQKNKSRQKCVEEVDKEHLSPLVKPGGQPCILPMLPTIACTQPRELFHHSCQIKPSDLLLGDLMSSEERFSYTNLSSNFADEMLQSFYCEEQESDGIGNVFGPSAFTGEWANDGQGEDLDTNEQQHHGDVAGEDHESGARRERFATESNLLAQFKPADVLPENFLLSVTQLNSVLQQEDESRKEGDTPKNEQEADGAASTQYREDMKTYIKELDTLFTMAPPSTFSHEDCSHLRSTISCCADVLNHLLSASNNSVVCEAQIPTYPHESPNNTTASQEGPQHTIQPDNPLPLLTLQRSNNAQHPGHSGTMTLQPGVLPHIWPANAVTMQQVEDPNGTQHLLPFRFTPSLLDAESCQLPGQHLLSPYCPTQHHHCTNVHMDIGQGPITFSGAAVMESRKLQ